MFTKAPKKIIPVLSLKEADVLVKEKRGNNRSEPIYSKSTHCLKLHLSSVS